MRRHRAEEVALGFVALWMIDSTFCLLRIGQDQFGKKPKTSEPTTIADPAAAAAAAALARVQRQSVAVVTEL